MEDNKIKLLAKTSLSGGTKTLLEDLYLFFKRLWELQVTEEDILVTEKIKIDKANSKTKFYIERIPDKQLKIKNKNFNNKNIYWDNTFQRYKIPLIALKMIIELEQQEKNVSKYKINPELLKSIEEKEFKNYINDLIAKNNKLREGDKISLRFWKTIIEEQNNKGTILEDFLEQLKSDDSIIKSNTSEKIEKTVQEIDWIKINPLDEKYWKFLNSKENKPKDIEFKEINKKGIISNFINIKEYLSYYSKRKIRIPIFQRDYSWDKDNIIALLEMIYKSNNSDNTDKPEFIKIFLNNIILTRDDDDCLNIIDGQQRSITFFLILIAFAKLYSYKAAKLENSDDANKINLSFLNFSDESEENQNNSLSVLAKILVKWTKDENNHIKNAFSWICEWIEDKYKNKEIKEIKKVIDFFLTKIALNLTQIKLSDFFETSNIFKNINLYTKPLEILDIFKNDLYLKLEPKEKEEDKFVEDSIKIYENTWNLYFRYENKKENKTIKELLEKFLYSLKVFYKIKYKQEKNSNSLVYQEKIFSDILDKILENKKSNENYSELLLEILLKDFIIFEFIINKKLDIDIKKTENKKIYIDTIKTNLQNNSVSNDNIRYTNFLDQLKDSLKNLNFIREQIRHITRKSTKDIFVYPIFVIIKSLKIFDGNTENLKLVSQLLYELEKLSLNWTWFHFDKHWGRKYLIEFAEKILEILENQDTSKEDKIEKFKNVLKELNQQLQFSDFSSKWTSIVKDSQMENEFKNRGWTENNNEKFIILRRIMAHFSNGLKNTYNSDANENNFINYDDDYSYEHAIPQSLLKDNENNNDINKNIQQLGNGILLTKKENSSLQNNLQEKEKIAINDFRISDSNYSFKGYSITDKNNKEETTLLRPGKDIYLTFLNKPNETQEIIEERTKQIFKIYFDIFNEESDNKEIENSLD
ncbi:DUF262 domain-containing protein [Mycoplasma sp. CB776]